MNFVEYQKYRSPTTFQEDPIDKFEKILGQEKDDVDLGANNAVSTGFVSTAPDDALNSLGHNFNIDRPPPISNVAWRLKLSKAWDFWKTAGTPARMITEIKDYGYPNVTILPCWLEISPGNWVKTLPIRDPQPDMDLPTDDPIRPYRGQAFGVGWWSSFWIIIRQPHPFTPIFWGTPESGKWGVGGTFGPYKWGGIAGPQEDLNALVKLIKKLKPAWTSCRGIVFGYAGFDTWGSPDWGDGTLWGVTSSDYSVYYIRENWET